MATSGDGRITDELQVRGHVERVARESYGRLLAFLASRYGIDAAQDALSDAFAAALERWPVDGVPQNAPAWILVTARHRFIDAARREQRQASMVERLATITLEAQHAFESGAAPKDERLAMLFACAHPSIAPNVRAPLMLQIVLGIDAVRIASAFLVAPAAMSQRLVRAKRKLVNAGVPLRVPDEEQFPQRLQAVLAAIYAAFCQGWEDPTGIDPRARGLADEAIWLGRLVVEACPEQAEALGLLSLMLHAHARRKARRDDSGAFAPLDEQNVHDWDASMIDEAERLLVRAASLGQPGRFQLEAAIQSAHAIRRTGAKPDWNAIVLLYDSLVALTASPVVALNRAAAIARARDPHAGLRALDALDTDTLAEYQPYWATRADLCIRAGKTQDALLALQRAIGLTIDPAIRDFLSERASALQPARATVTE